MEIQIDENQLRDVQTMMTGIKDGYPKVVSRAVNKTLTGVRTDAVGEISKKLNLTKTRIRKDFEIKKATRVYLFGRIVSKGVPVGLAAFTGTKQRAKGVSVKVKKSGKRTILKHTFLADVTKARSFGTYTNTLVFYRLYEGTRAPFRSNFRYGVLPRKYRFPKDPKNSLEAKTGPRIQDIYDEPEVMKPVMKMADDRLTVNLQRELNFELSKL